MYEQLTALYNSNEYPMHMPGHKRQTGFCQPFDAVKIDITEIPGYDDLYSPDGIIKEALDRASALYDTKDTFFLVNGSTVGILTAVYALTRQHGRILMARNCHKSVYHAAELREL
ncbi:MAG: amino acid decarboxylase, partial [Lachnospiraceae bacterium]|nr:amino acid decarboxylase [Lachnospiraceae bacterium]